MRASSRVSAPIHGLLPGKKRCVDCALGPFGARTSGATGGRALTEFYREYLAVAVLMLAAIGMVAAMLSVGRLVRPSRPQDEKFISYEAGSDPVGSFGQSNVRYYVYALLFVMFDVEAVFIFPWAVNVDSLGWFGLVEVTVFVAILTLGLLYAWRKGVLRWA
jgi:NADH-quinone oxidoreductase subunit A